MYTWSYNDFRLQDDYIHVRHSLYAIIQEAIPLKKQPKAHVNEAINLNVHTVTGLEQNQSLKVGDVQLSYNLTKKKDHK